MPTPDFSAMEAFSTPAMTVTAMNVTIGGPGLNALAVSLGKGNGLLYACDPNLASFFASGEALKAEVGEMGPAGTAGKAGWKELSPSVEFLKFTMWPEGFKKMLFDDDMTIFDQFIAPAIQDMP